jgi:organic radical activating enzyme
MNDNGSFCSLLWTHLCVRTDNTLKPCCRFQSNNPTNEFKETLDDVQTLGQRALNTDYYRDIRNMMLNGDTVPGCQKCYSQENIKGNSISMRQLYNEKYKRHLQLANKDFDSIRYIEMSIDNICNLQCRMCDSKFSSKLQNRDRILGKTVHKKLEPNFNKLLSLDLKNLDRVKILGGEPFITPNFDKFLNFLDKNANIENIVLDIATNGTSIPSQKNIDILKRFRSIDISVSMDSFNKSNDYQRMGSNYKTVYSNALQYQQILKNAVLSFHITVSNLNANTLADTVNKLQKEQHHFSVDFVRDPDYLCLLYTPDLYRSWVLKKNKHNKTAYRLLKTFLNESKPSIPIWDKFIETNNKLDNYYKVNLNDYNSDLYKHLKTYKG